MKALALALALAGCAAAPAEPPPLPPPPPPAARPAPKPAAAVPPATQHATERVLVDTEAVRLRAVCYVLEQGTPPDTIERVTRLTLRSAAATARLREHKSPANVRAARAAAEALVHELPTQAPPCPTAEALKGGGP